MNIREDVLRIIAAQSGVNRDYISDDHKLKKQPLTFDSYGMIYLAEALRAYVRQHSGGEGTVRKSEIDKSGFTVSDVVDLVTKKLTRTP